MPMHIYPDTNVTQAQTQEDLEEKKKSCFKNVFRSPVEMILRFFKLNWLFSEHYPPFCFWTNEIAPLHSQLYLVDTPYHVSVVSLLITAWNQKPDISSVSLK